MMGRGFEGFGSLDYCPRDHVREVIMGARRGGEFACRLVPFGEGRARIGVGVGLPALARERKLYSGDRDQRPLHYTVQSFVEIVGDKGVTQITRADVSTWLA